MLPLGLGGCIFALYLTRQGRRFGAFPLFGLNQFYPGEAAVFTLTLGLKVAETRRTVRMNAAGELGVAVLLVEAFSDSIAHVSIMGALQFGNAQNALIVAG